MKNIRNSITTDKNQILSFCTNTFSWGDYIHEVWDSWENDGGLAIIEEENTAVAMCHGVQYKSEDMLWIEGIRVKEEYRKNGYATSLITHFEKLAINSDIRHVDMLIESENTNSLNLVKKLGYHTISKWNYFSSKVKKKSYSKIKFDSVKFSDLENLEGLLFVESWRWIPLTESNFKRISLDGNILCLKKDEIIQSLGIITESDSFHDTIILTLIFGTLDDIHKIILYAQNLASKKNYSKIRIITKKDTLELDILGKKFPFYLVEKIL